MNPTEKLRKVIEDVLAETRKEALQEAAHTVLVHKIPRNIGGVPTEGALYVGIADRDDEIAQAIRSLIMPKGDV